jgi:hypothetical protein
MPTRKSVSEVAYDLWVRRGRPHGSAEHDWFEAERQMSQQQDPLDSREAHVDSAIEDSFPASDPPASHRLDEPASNARERPTMAGHSDHGEVTLVRAGKTYGATYTVERGMLQLKTHTETRSVEVGEQDPTELARRTLKEIIDAQSRK